MLPPRLKYSLRNSSMWLSGMRSPRMNSSGVRVPSMRFTIMKSAYMPHSVLRFWCCFRFSWYLNRMPSERPCWVTVFINSRISFCGRSPVLSKKKM